MGYGEFVYNTTPDHSDHISGIAKKETTIGERDLQRSPAHLSPKIPRVRNISSKKRLRKTANRTKKTSKKRTTKPQDPEQ